MSKKSSTVATRLKGLVIYCGRIACEDESASEVEQLEKVLYYYPPNHIATRRLNHVSLCEGLTGFADRFCPGDPIETVHMQNNRYVFEQLEPEVWMVAMVAEPSDADPSAVGTADDAALHSLMQQLYETMVLFHGSITEWLEAPVGVGDGGAAGPSGLDVVEHIQNNRKALRKLAKLADIDDHYRDLDAAGQKAAREADLAKRRSLEAELEGLVSVSPVESLRAVIGPFLNAAVASIDMSRLDAFHDMSGFHFCPADSSSFLSAHQLQSRLRHMFSFDEAAAVRPVAQGGAVVPSPRAIAGKGSRGGGGGGSGGEFSDVGAGLLSVTLMFDGQMVWSGLDQHQMVLVYNHLKNHDTALHALKYHKPKKNSALKDAVGSKEHKVRERKSSFVPSFSMPNPEKILQKLKDEMGGTSSSSGSGEDILSSIMDGFTSAPADGSAEGAGGGGGDRGAYDPASIGFIGSGFTSLDFLPAAAAAEGGSAGRREGGATAGAATPRVFDRVRGADAVIDEKKGMSSREVEEEELGPSAATAREFGASEWLDFQSGATNANANANANADAEPVCSLWIPRLHAPRKCVGSGSSASGGTTLWAGVGRVSYYGPGGMPSRAGVGEDLFGTTDYDDDEGDEGGFDMAGVGMGAGPGAGATADEDEEDGEAAMERVGRLLAYQHGRCTVVLEVDEDSLSEPAPDTAANGKRQVTPGTGGRGSGAGDGEAMAVAPVVAAAEEKVVEAPVDPKEAARLAVIAERKAMMDKLAQRKRDAKRRARLGLGDDDPLPPTKAEKAAMEAKKAAEAAAKGDGGGGGGGEGGGGDAAVAPADLPAYMRPTPRRRLSVAKVSRFCEQAQGVLRPSIDALYAKFAAASKGVGGSGERRGSVMAGVSGVGGAGGGSGGSGGGSGGGTGGTGGSSGGSNALDGTRFVYFNGSNLSVKTIGIAASTEASTIPPQYWPATQAVLPEETLRAINDMHATFNADTTGVARCGGQAEEMAVRLPNLEWVIGKRFGDRELFILLDSRFASLEDAQGECDKLRQRIMGSILVA